MLLMKLMWLYYVFFDIFVCVVIDVDVMSCVLMLVYMSVKDVCCVMLWVCIMCCGCDMMLFDCGLCGRLCIGWFVFDFWLWL